MQSGTPFFQVLPGAAQATGQAFPQAYSNANTCAPLSLKSKIVFSFINASVSRPAVVPPLSGQLHSPAGPDATTSFYQATRDLASTRKNFKVFTSWAHPASASGFFASQDIRDIVIDKGPLMQEHSATSPSDSTPQLSNYLINF